MSVIVKTLHQLTEENFQLIVTLLGLAVFGIFILTQWPDKKEK